MVRSLLAVSALALFAPACLAQKCSSIHDLDVANATIAITADDSNEFNTSFNGPGMPGSIRLQDGASSLASRGHGTAEWEVHLTSNRLLRPDPSTEVRVIVLERVHIQGTGAWHYIIVLGSYRGDLNSLFQFSGEGVSLTGLEQMRLLLTQAMWQPGDAHCCPTRRRELRFDWDAAVHRYHRMPETQ